MMAMNWLCHSLRASLTLIGVLAIARCVVAQEHRERTLDEIKTEAMKRAENGMYPLIGLDPSDVREAFASIKTTDNDEWAAGFSAVADRYMAQAKALEAIDPARASATYVKAWRLYSFRKAARLRQSPRGFSRARKVNGSAARSRAHSL